MTILNTISLFGLPWICSQQVAGFPSKTAQNSIHTRDTPSPVVGIKTPDPAGNQTRVTSMVGSDSANNAMAAEITLIITY